MNVTDRRHTDRWQTDRPHYGELCKNRQNRLSCKSNSA